MDVPTQRDHVIRYYRTMIADFAMGAIDIVTLKGEDYAPERIAMVEVFFTAAELGVSAPQILWVHVCKHKSAIASYLRKGSLKSEDIRSRLMDVANYMALIDSYVADPMSWLHHLQQMVDTGEFPNRTDEEIAALRAWIATQLIALVG